MNNKAVIIGVVALVVIVAAVAVALGSGDDGGEDDTPEVYHYSIRVSQSSTIGYIATIYFEEYVEPGTTITLSYEGQELNSIVLQGSGQQTPGVGSSVGVRFLSNFGHTMEELEGLLEVQVGNFETVRA